MNELFKIIGIAVVGGVMALMLRQYNPVFGMLIALGAGAVILLMLCNITGDVIDGLKKIIETGKIDSGYVKIVIKVIGIAYITQFGAEMLRDSGEGALASKCEMAGKLFILYLTIPVIGDFLKMCIEIVEF